MKISECRSKKWILSGEGLRSDMLMFTFEFSGLIGRLEVYNRTDLRFFHQSRRVGQKFGVSGRHGAMDVGFC